MPRTAWLLLALCTGCASLPSIEPAKTPEQARLTTAQCRSAFPATPQWSAIHSIDASLPFGNNAILMGVTAVDPKGMHTVLLSPEGLALFDATTQGKTMTVRRALPPLDRNGFAEGLVGDVQHTFFAPPGTPAQVGTYEDGAGACRWLLPGDEATDVRVDRGRPTMIRNFKGTGMVRTVQLNGESSDGWYPEVLLEVPGIGGYKLRMTLVDHQEGADATQPAAGSAATEPSPPTPLSGEAPTQPVTAPVPAEEAPANQPP